VFDNVTPPTLEQKLQEVYIEIGMQYLRENDNLRNTLIDLLKEREDWTGLQVWNYINQGKAHNKVRDSMQVQPGVVVMSQSISGRLTANPMGNDPSGKTGDSYGVTSRNHPGNAVTREANGLFTR